MSNPLPGDIAMCASEMNRAVATEIGRKSGAAAGDPMGGAVPMGDMEVWDKYMPNDPADLLQDQGY